MIFREPRTPPLLVLGLGNVLLRDDGFGIQLLRRIADAYVEEVRVECVDGGTQGLALLGLLEGREAILVLDAWQQGDAPGTLHLTQDPLAQPTRRGISAHEGNATELLAACSLTGELPRNVTVLGVEPEQLSTGIGLTSAVERSLEEAFSTACGLIESMLLEIDESMEAKTHA